jgi:RNA polymerase sigma-70 factor (ECF subfamily)
VEDLVQSTFLEVVGQRARYDGRSSVKTWLFAIATNIVRRHRRATARRWKLAWLLASVEPRIDESLSSQLDARRDVERVRTAFAALSEKARLAFLLCEVEGFSAKEAGQVLGSNEVTVWKRVSDARKALARASREGQR